MISLRADLHVHTVLSPCAEIEMLPPLIIMEAQDRGIQLLAITDHNASANFPAVHKAAEGTGITVLPGMEIQTREEVHVLCLFDTLDQVNDLQAYVDSLLPALKNDSDFFGDQLVVDPAGDFLYREERLLLNSIDATIEEVCARVQQMGGLFAPAHVDRKAFGLINNLGIIPPGLPVDAVEISRHIEPKQAVRQFPQLAGYPIIQNGDAHRLDEITGAMQLQVEDPTVTELKMAFQNRCGRSHTFLSLR